MSLRIDRAPARHALHVVASGADLSIAVRVCAVLFVTVLTAAAAQVSIPLPFTPVPFTLQPMIVLLGGAALGSRLGMSQPGAVSRRGYRRPAGLRRLADPSAGLARLLGPTGGYLMSYPFAALLTGALAERGFDRRFLSSVLAMGSGLVVIFSCGVAWMAWGAAPVGLDRALAAGLYPFVLVDVLKVVARGLDSPNRLEVVTARVGPPVRTTGSRAPRTRIPSYRTYPRLLSLSIIS